MDIDGNARVCETAREVSCDHVSIIFSFFDPYLHTAEERAECVDIVVTVDVNGFSIYIMFGAAIASNLQPSSRTADFTSDVRL